MLNPSYLASTLVDWYRDYLSLRQGVVLPGVNSEWTYIKAGVPQGFVLGPLHLLTYIDNIVNGIGLNIRLFVKDTSFYIIVVNCQYTRFLLHPVFYQLKVQWPRLLLSLNTTYLNKSVIVALLLKMLYLLLSQHISYVNNVIGFII